MSKIIKPEGMELLDYINRGDPICNKCGALMDRKDDPKGGCGFYVCPACGWKIDEMDYEYDNGDIEESEWAPNLESIFRNDMPPAGCRACGGPYPDCKSSCKLFDD